MSTAPTSASNPVDRFRELDHGFSTIRKVEVHSGFATVEFTMAGKAETFTIRSRDVDIVQYLQGSGDREKAAEWLRGLAGSIQAVQQDNVQKISISPGIFTVTQNETDHEGVSHLKDRSFHLKGIQSLDLKAYSDTSFVDEKLKLCKESIEKIAIRKIELNNQIVSLKAKLVGLSYFNIQTHHQIKKLEEEIKSLDQKKAELSEESNRIKFMHQAAKTAMIAVKIPTEDIPKIEPTLRPVESGWSATLKSLIHEQAPTDMSLYFKDKLPGDLEKIDLSKFHETQFSQIPFDEPTLSAKSIRWNTYFGKSPDLSQFPIKKFVQPGFQDEMGKRFSVILKAACEKGDISKIPWNKLSKSELQTLLLSLDYNTLGPEITKKLFNLLEKKVDYQRLLKYFAKNVKFDPFINGITGSVEEYFKSLNISDATQFFEFIAHLNEANLLQNFIINAIQRLGNTKEDKQQFINYLITIFDHFDNTNAPLEIRRNFFDQMDGLVFQELDISQVQLRGQIGLGGFQSSAYRMFTQIYNNKFDISMIEYILHLKTNNLIDQTTFDSLIAKLEITVKNCNRDDKIEVQKYINRLKQIQDPYAAEIAAVIFDPQTESEESATSKHENDFHRQTSVIYEDSKIYSKPIDELSFRYNQLTFDAGFELEDSQMRKSYDEHVKELFNNHPMYRDLLKLNSQGTFLTPLDGIRFNSEFINTQGNALVTTHNLIKYDNLLIYSCEYMTYDTFYTEEGIKYIKLEAAILEFAIDLSKIDQSNPNQHLTDILSDTRKTYFSVPISDTMTENELISQNQKFHDNLKQLFARDGFVPQKSLYRLEMIKKSLDSSGVPMTSRTPSLIDLTYQLIPNLRGENVEGVDGDAKGILNRIHSLLKQGLSLPEIEFDELAHFMDQFLIFSRDQQITDHKEAFTKFVEKLNSEPDFRKQFKV